MRENFCATLVYPKQLTVREMDLETARALTAAEAETAEAQAQAQTPEVQAAEAQAEAECSCPCPCCSRVDTDEQDEKDCTCTCECCVASRSVPTSALEEPVVEPKTEQEAGHDHTHDHDHDHAHDDEGDGSDEGEDEPEPWELALTPAVHQEHSSAMPSFGGFQGGSPVEFDLACAEDPQLAAAMHYKIGERVHAPFDMWGLHDVSAAGWSARRNIPVSYIATRFMMYQTWAMGLSHAREQECESGGCPAPPTSPRGSKSLVSRPATPAPSTEAAGPANDEE
jgi:hypothetical protein